jgi:Acetyltransferases, including N-acetylases of ribosomal proteins
MIEPLAGLPRLAAPLEDVTTERLVLRRFAIDDLDALAAVFAKIEVWQFPYGRAFTRDETQAFLESQIAHWDSCGVGCWLVIERANDRVIGYAGLSVPTFLPEVLPALEVGWRFDPEVWGRGFATEAARAALTQAFTTLRLDEVCSIPQAENVASVRVAERIGMHRERIVTIPANERRGTLSAVLFRITHADWDLSGGTRSG